ncbi:hypothetical protein [Deinococcus sp. SL84]|uniref:hypothetical protein n=1 Tax=Deinococcus sp. SL84 TaxID=2994663 RepID=UPI002273C7FF|nr:hypothetical protein [Deinococcus sp. SL84]MCY1703716.1 hypothetical protein [Deinococcus sp. SL84]
MSKRRRSLELPNYTQTPNVIFDELMSVMSNAELRVTLVVVRHTLGWHVKKTEGPLPLPEIARMAGISLRSASTGTQEGVKRGLLVRHACHDADGRKTYAYSLNFEADPGKLYQVIERDRPTPAKFAWVFARVFKVPTPAKFARVSLQNLHVGPDEAPLQNLHASYKEQRNLLLKNRRRKKAAASEEIGTQPNASSSEKDLATPGEKISEAIPSQTQAPDVQTAADLPSQNASVHVASDECEKQSKAPKEVPGARENTHEGEQKSESADHDVAAVNDRIHQITNQRWKGHWINEIGSSGINRHQIAELVTPERLEALWDEARADALKQTDGKKLAPVTLLIHKLEKVVLHHEQLRSQMAEARHQRTQVAKATEPAERKPGEWRVGDEVWWRGKLAEVVTVTGHNLELYLLDSRETVSVYPGQYDELELAGERQLTYEEIDKDRLEELKPKVGRATQRPQPQV